MNDFKYEKGVLADFLGNNWALFLAFCEEFRIDGSRADAFVEHLKTEAGI